MFHGRNKQFSSSTLDKNVVAQDNYSAFRSTKFSNSDCYKKSSINQHESISTPSLRLFHNDISNELQRKKDKVKKIVVPYIAKREARLIPVIPNYTIQSGGSSTTVKSTLREVVPPPLFFN